MSSQPSPESSSRAKTIAFAALGLIAALVVVIIVFEPLASKNPAHGTAQPATSAASQSLLRASEAAGFDGPARCHPSHRARGTVLIFGPGGWLLPGVLLMGPVCRALAAKGYEVANLGYPLKDPLAANAFAARAARGERGRRCGRIFALGISAGGTIAAMLAARHELDAATAVSPVADLTDWHPDAMKRDWGMTERDLWQASPVYRVSKDPAPLIIFHSRSDDVADYRDSVRLARRSRRFRLVTYVGGHGDKTVGQVPYATRWMEHMSQARRTTCGYHR